VEEIHLIMGEWLTTHEAARLANLDPDYIRKLVWAEKIKARKWGVVLTGSARHIADIYEKIQRDREQAGSQEN